MADSHRSGAHAAPGETEPDRIVRAIVGGRVQGIGYRMWTQAEAEALGVGGWVRNRRNGDVEALFAGPAAAVEALCQRLWRGPAAARVDRVEVADADERDLAGNGATNGFRQIATI
jgi:acylphosphatase